MTATPPFNLDVSNPTDAGLGNAFPTNERSFRDNVNTYINTEHDINTGWHKFQEITTTTKNALSSPPTGMLVWDTTLVELDINTGTPGAPTWTPVIGHANASGWLYNTTHASPGSATYSAVASDSATIFNSGSAGAALTVTLPNTSSISAGWYAMFVHEGTHLITATVEGSHSERIQLPIGQALTSASTYDGDYEFFLLVFDGVNYRVTDASPNTWNALGSQAGQFYNRTIQSGNTDYYVNWATGNDTNNGTMAKPWKTLQGAFNYLLAHIDLAGFIATVHVADNASYTGLSAQGRLTGATQSAASLVFLGNTTTPANVVVTDSSAIYAQDTEFTIKGMTLVGTDGASGTGISSENGAVIHFANIHFGACGYSCMAAGYNGVLSCNDGGVAWSVVASSPRVIFVDFGGIVDISGSTATISGTPAWSTGFAIVGTGELIAESVTFSGSATGVRGLATLNGVIQTARGAAGTWDSYFPGNMAGTSTLGGVYN